MPSADSAQRGGASGVAVGRGNAAPEPANGITGGEPASTAAEVELPEMGAPVEETGSPSRHALGATTQLDDVALPEFEIHTLEADEVLLDRADASSTRTMHPLTGIWEQIAGSNDADFAPGGFVRSVLMLNPALKTAAIYRVFRGNIALVVGGEFALDCKIDGIDRRMGELEIRNDPSLNSKFRTDKLSLGGVPEVFMLPPTSDGNWHAAWKRDGMEITIGSARYAAITRDAFEKLRRGGGDVATAADLNERIPGRRTTTETEQAYKSSFFGLDARGKSICFVVDISGSMAGPKLDRLKKELTRTISAFPPTVAFSVIFFDSDAYVMDQAWMKGAPDQTRALTLIAQQSTGGGTDPTSALEFAFSNLNPIPDCIFFMTDGLFAPTTPALLNQLNVGQHKTVVHTIAFGERGAESMMKQIASEHGGDYRFIEP